MKRMHIVSLNFKFDKNMLEMMHKISAGRQDIVSLLQQKITGDHRCERTSSVYYNREDEQRDVDQTADCSTKQEQNDGKVCLKF